MGDCENNVREVSQSLYVSIGSQHALCESPVTAVALVRLEAHGHPDDGRDEIYRRLMVGPE